MLRPEQLRPSRSTLAYTFVAVLATAPAWIVRHPPLQDLPFHLATLRVIHNYRSPAFGFDRDFTLSLWHTQYILYYLAGTALAYVLGVFKANVALMCLYLGGTVLALRELLRALGRDERLCLFVLPLLVNVMFVFGLLPFMIGIPLMFVALAQAARHLTRPSMRGGVILAVLAMACFYAHVLPFALFGVGFCAMFPWSRPREWLRAGAPTVPALLLLGWWVLRSAAGVKAAGALGSGDSPVAPLGAALGSFFEWSTDVFADTTDELYVIALGLLVLACLGLSLGDKDKSKRIGRGYVLLPIACFVLYFTTGGSLGDVWLLSQRFPILALMTSIPVLRMPTGARGVLATAAALGVGVGSLINTCKHFIQFEREEVGDIDGAIDAMEPRKRVAGLIYDRSSSVMNMRFAPFLHFVSYYQLDKGGVTVFTYAGFPHWPITFKPDRAPPGFPLRLRWEWTPEQVSLGELVPYYDYVLTRGPGFRPLGTFHPVWRSSHWTVWSRDGR